MNLSRLRERLLELVESKDHSLSLTKLAACTAHLSMAVNFWLVSFGLVQFVAELWLIYAGLTIGHASTDKIVAMYHARKANVAKPADQ